MRLLSMCAVVVSIVGLSEGAQAAPIQWTVAAGGNGHYYEIVSSPSIAWSDANAAASSSSHLGAQGYLATVTSTAENAFITATFGNGELFGPWIGGSDAAVEGEWRWVTGPESGTQFWSGDFSGAATGPFNYANWANVPAAGFQEPNNSVGIEHYAHLIFSSANGLVPGTWNDGQDNGGGNIGSYLVEYGVRDAPEPASLLLVSAGFYAVFRRRRG